MFTMEFTHRLFSQGPRQQIPAMNRVKDILKSANFSGTVFPFSKGYAAWETDEVSWLPLGDFWLVIYDLHFQIIAGELYRNLGLAIACISVTTLILLSSLLGCLQVVGCVLLTLVNVAGFMHFWGNWSHLKTHLVALFDKWNSRSVRYSGFKAPHSISGPFFSCMKVMWEGHISFDVKWKILNGSFHSRPNYWDCIIDESHHQHWIMCRLPGSHNPWIFSCTG